MASLWVLLICGAVMCCRFVYEEEGDAGAFFVPYLWGLVRARASWLKVSGSDAATLTSTTS